MNTTDNLLPASLSPLPNQFRLFILWSPRLIFILALLIFCYHFYEMWTRYVWPEIRGIFLNDKVLYHHHHWVILFFLTQRPFFILQCQQLSKKSKFEWWMKHFDIIIIFISNDHYLFSWTSINPNVLSAPEILSQWAKLKELLAHLVAEIVDLRQRSHGTFSFLTITVLAVIYYIGKCIPGVILLYSFGKKGSSQS